MARAPASLLTPLAAGGVDVLIIAGEHSGDQNAARMLRDFRSAQPHLRVAALGGPALGQAGAELLRDLTAHSVIGFVDALKNLSHFRRLLVEIVAWIRTHRPRLVCFVDSSGLNLRIAERLYQAGLAAKAGGPCRLVYYISPQIWASRAKRRFAMAQHLDALAVIFPFERGCYADTSLSVEFVGHPFLASDYRAPVSYASDGPVLLLPGSRLSAAQRIFPRMLGAWREAGRPAAAVIYPSEALRKRLYALAGDDAGRLGWLAAGTPTTASAVLTTSGTMSMHCALAGIPGAVVYVAHPLEYLLGRLIIQVPHLGIASLLLAREVYPEFIQGAATPTALARVLHAIRTEVTPRDQLAKAAGDLRTLLSAETGGGPGVWLARQWAAALETTE